MNKDVALVVALVIGGVVALQGPLNSQLARSVGGLPATTIALGVSFIVAAHPHGVARPARRTSADVGRAPAYVIVGGGLVGALFVASIVWTVRALGVGGLSAATLAGQFAAALRDRSFRLARGGPIPDHGLEAGRRGLLAAGTYLIVSD